LKLGIRERPKRNPERHLSRFFIRPNPEYLRFVAKRCSVLAVRIDNDRAGIRQATIGCCFEKNGNKVRFACAGGPDNSTVPTNQTGDIYVGFSAIEKWTGCAR
jgi:hypothetical protein